MNVRTDRQTDEPHELYVYVGLAPINYIRADTAYKVLNKQLQ